MCWGMKKSDGDKECADGVKVCPICKKRIVLEGGVFRPFCSKRCKLIDLGEWASGNYRVAGEPVKQAPEETEEGSDE